VEKKGGTGKKNMKNAALSPRSVVLSMGEEEKNVEGRNGKKETIAAAAKPKDEFGFPRKALLIKKLRGVRRFKKLQTNVKKVHNKQARRGFYKSPVDKPPRTGLVQGCYYTTQGWQVVGRTNKKGS